MIGYGGYIEGCVDVVGSNEGTNNWGWRCKYSYFISEFLLVDATYSLCGHLLLVPNNLHGIVEGIEVFR